MLSRRNARRSSPLCATGGAPRGHPARGCSSAAAHQAARTARHGYRGPEDHSAKLVFYRRKAVAPLPPEMRRVGAAAPEGAVHVLLIWDGPDFRSSSRLAPPCVFM